MTGAEFREMASNKRMQMQFTDIQGGIEKECWGGFYLIHINFELADKIFTWNYKVRVRYTSLIEQLELEIHFCDHQHKDSI